MIVGERACLSTALLSNFEVAAKQITLLHYGDDLGIPLRMAKLMPVASVPAREP